MNSDKLDLSVDMVICMAIKDYASDNKISEDEARNRLMSSKAVELLYDSDNKLWAEGPDSLIRLYEEIG